MSSQLFKKSSKNLTSEKPSMIDQSFSKGTLNVAVMIGAFALPSLSAQAYERIVAMSPDVADVVVALGATDKLVGKDATNDNPALKSVPAVGMHRNITAESVLAVKPDLVLGSYMVQPASIYQRLNSLKVKAVNVAPKEQVSTFANSIKSIGSYVGKKPQGSELAKRWNADMSPMAKTGKRYLLSYDGRIVAGKGTVGDELIRRAGGINAANVSGLKPMSREGWLAAKPDVIIIADHNQAVVGGVGKFSKRPEIAASAAGKNGGVHFWPADDFLRYGLNSPQILKRLHSVAK
ncbi:MAG: heme/hemin ABC transporter substrate-binding protein [Psychrobacter sp.]|uniref:heme/hemin ABC transporter substrate-binding protein n=1 Tax=unclassified Psychrobacter TaxID=196806 RepID=UPI001787AD74|nr:ABC transporter substrate-binding protein [Psychrobacter sp. FME5]MBE0445173.1 ABC transporter substrate-binding protein [Psychrobacter sp. FME5]MDN5801904.1 ABC transporter substrate-binding protein [Psychrobacter sp.]